jgi:hypothetical protein
MEVSLISNYGIDGYAYEHALSLTQNLHGAYSMLTRLKSKQLGRGIFSS